MRRVLIFAGPNGSGKSTLTTPENLARFGIPQDRYINADEIAKEAANVSASFSQEERERHAFALARKSRQTFRESGESFAFETVFSHPSSLLDMKRCQQAGFEIIVIFVTTRNPEINVKRVAGRFLAGGHSVPEDRIHSRYHRTMALLPRILEEADQWFLYDNSDTTPEAVGWFVEKSSESLDVLVPWVSKLSVARLSRKFFANDESSSPDEASGSYIGKIANINSHYILQKVNKQLIRHDRLLVHGEFSEGQLVTIQYKDAVGEVL